MPGPSVPTDPATNPANPDHHAIIQPSNEVARRSAADDNEYRANYISAEYVNAFYAVEHGWNGEGVLVGVLDNGVKEIAELEGQISPLSREFGGTSANGEVTPFGNVGDENSDHGTMVASIIAAKDDGAGVQGFAPAAQIVALRTDVQHGSDTDRNVGYNGHKAIAYAADHDVLLVNRSLAKGVAAIPDRLMQQAVRDYAARGGLVINSAGNFGGQDAADSIDLTPENAQGWLFVTAIEPNGESYELASYANRCGIAMERCVAGVGTNITVNAHGQTVAFTGTSSSAPQVTALAALIMSKWPQLTGVDAGNVILSTARDIGAEGVDAEFGHGLVDFEAALAPVDPTISNGSVASPAEQTAMIVPAALSGANQIETALASVTVLDAFGRDYTGDLSGLVLRSADQAGTATSRTLERRASAQRGQFAAGPVRADFSYSALRRSQLEGDVALQLDQARFAVAMGDLTLTAGLRSGDMASPYGTGLAPRSDAMAAYIPVAETSIGLARSMADGALALSVHTGSDGDLTATGAMLRWSTPAVTVKLGLADERGSVFGTPTGAGALRLGDGTQTAFAELSRNFDLSGWTLGAYAGLGATRLKLAPDMLLTDADTIASTRFGINLARQIGDMRLALGIAQPLTAIAGSGTLTVGSGYDRDARALAYAEHQIDLTGSIMPRLSVGLDGGTRRSAWNIGFSANGDGSDARAFAGWTIHFER